MKYDIWLVDEKDHSRICSWWNDELSSHVNRADDLDNLFDVMVTIGDHEVSEFSRTLKSVVMDILINQRLILSGATFGYSISDTPFFKTYLDRSDVVFILHSARGQVEVRESIDCVDYELSTQGCRGLHLIKTLTSTTIQEVFKSVKEDLESENRRDFIMERGHSFF